MKPLVLDPRAQEELREAIEYYEEQAPGLGRDFLSAIESATEGIRNNPTRWPRYEGTSFRYCLVRRFPYLVFFDEQEDRIWVAAISHGRRRPDYWRSRRES